MRGFLKERANLRGIVLEIPYQNLSPEALRGVLEEYATRGGFESDAPLEERLEELLAQLSKGKARIVYDPEEGTATLVASSGA